MDKGRAIGPKGSRYYRFGVCLALFSLGACSSSNSYREPTPDPDRLAEAEARAEEDAEAQLEKDLAIAAIENDRGEPPRLLGDDEFEGVLEYYCSDCHSTALAPFSTASNPLLFATAEDLIEFGKITPGDAAMSRLVRRLWAGEMPPVGRAKPVPPATIELIADFVDNLPPPLD
jgi:hypothetical protein